ncbi:MAG: Uma2 family endonuclease [Microcoleus sp. PH2017_01_SCD_O_A]|uniref:Uma2 family endonuclease n=1 Tax=unclassified Microcoleus TaxID=2642155 RepID=UPI001D5B4916|nr:MULTISPECIES: Uma2 family endonuclease [unclassified Microcoleus]TAG61232.1 MAG: Uma2 family endonuclease [Oscillatoriales cyanobacterium]MCC3423352.1 Uma2 family endonuclease [Microcoleus sp. PH2017_01_SCD_O_A]MCC3568435.1 Uma2 family endonuclease [Microcoleus sp. PH2017_31_RDM_U_A]MCC3571851.1 Uma2 family endonuclease [Microcoleus sp. PH2017_34_RAT_O_A]MCC3580708.1 Uma2 family endonuclease [Microcoleus sp. PH2017_32_RDM_D_A]
MIAKTLSPPEQIVELSNISWQTYETLLAEIGDRPIRLRYNRGNLKIMVPSPEHEIYKRVIGRFVETLAEELNVKIEPLGSTTFKRPELIGAEPDDCFYIQNVSAIKGKKRLDMSQDPPPDLVVEIDVTSRSDNTLQIYADLGVPEVWIYNGSRLRINRLESQGYVECEISLAFPSVAILEIVSFLAQAETMDYLELVKAFRNWVKSQINQNQ